MSGKGSSRLQEAHQPRIIGAQGKTWDVVLIQPGMSKNRFFYPADVLRASVPVFKDLKIYAYRLGKPLQNEFDHAPDEVPQANQGAFAQNMVGFVDNVRYGTFKCSKTGESGEGVLGTFHILEGHEWLRKNMREAWELGKPDILGFSINGAGQCRDAVIGGQQVKLVERLHKVHSTEVVSNPSAGGGLVRLVASAGMEGGTVEELLSLIRQHRPGWLEGFAKPEGDLSGHLTRVLEATLSQAEEVQKTIPNDEIRSLSEAARGVNSLSTTLRLLSSGEIANAKTLLKNWIGTYPVPEASAMRASFAHPYLKTSVEDEKPPEAPAAPAEPPAADPAPAAEPATEPAAEPPADPPAAEPKTDPAPAPATPAEGEGKDKPKEEGADVPAKTDAEKLAAREAALDVKESALLVERKLVASGLPELAQSRIKTLLEGKVDLTDEKIDEAIKTEREYIAKVTESGKPIGLGNAHDAPGPVVKVTMEQTDKWGKAFDGMFEGGVNAIDGITPFRSVREAFGKITGRYYEPEVMADVIFESIALAFPRNANRLMDRHLGRLRESWGSVPKSETLKESITTGDFPVAFGDSLFRRLQKEYTEAPTNDWRKIISSIENLSDLTNTFNIVRIGQTGTLPTVSQNAPYQELSDPTEANETMTPSKKGGLLKLTWEDILADRLGVIRRIPRMLGQSASRTVHELVWDLIDTNAALASDSTVLIDSATHANLVADATLSYAQVALMMEKLEEQTAQDSGKKLGLQGKFLLTGPQRKVKAIEITRSTVKGVANDNATTRSAVNFEGIEPMSSIGLGRSTSPDTSKRYWLAADPRDAESIAVGFLGGRDRPDIFVQSPVDTPTSGAAFEADAMTFKVRLGVGVALVDYRWIVGVLATS